MGGGAGDTVAVRPFSGRGEGESGGVGGGVGWGERGEGDTHSFWLRETLPLVEDPAG